MNSNTSASFKVDRKHNKISVVSMFGPSPDWVVGVSGLNLCKQDCSWESSLDIDLYPWDSGTDSGISYMSPNSETQPRERMHKITTKYPEDPRAPFYNPHSDQMTPLAKLFIRREKLITRNCDDEVLKSQIVELNESDDEENVEREYAMVSEEQNNDVERKKKRKYQINLTYHINFIKRLTSYDEASEFCASPRFPNFRFVFFQHHSSLRFCSMFSFTFRLL